MASRIKDRFGTNQTNRINLPKDQE